MPTGPSSTRHAPLVFPFARDPRLAVASLPFGVTAHNSRLELHHDRLVARFGPWSVETPLENVASACVTGPFSWWKVAGPAHLSFADRGLTFATSATEGVCLTFRRPVRGIDPLGAVRHPGLTVTVAEPHRLVDALDRATSAGPDREGAPR